MTTAEVTLVKLIDQEGPVLSGRMRAQSLRGALEAEINGGGHVTIDFEGVQAVSPSFADEIFVRFIGEVGADRVTFANLSPDLERVIRSVRGRR